MADEQALQTLRRIEEVRGRTREAVVWGWLPFLAFGIAMLASVPFTQINEGHALRTYWLIAGPLALAVTLLGYRRMEIRRGILERNEPFYAGLIGAMLVAAIAIGFLAEGGIASEVGPLFPIGVGLLVISAVDRSGLVAMAGALIVGLGVALAVLAPANADTWAALGSGVVLVGAGVLARGRDRRRRWSRSGDGPRPLATSGGGR
jgi:hypothetical protein